MNDSNFGYIYFLQASNNKIKIGFSKTPLTRKKELERQVKEELQFLLIIEGSKYLEKKLLENFRIHKINGEWFKNNQEITNFISANKVQNLSRIELEIGLDISLSMSNNLKKLLKTHNIKMVELAKKLNIPTSTLSTYIKNNKAAYCPFSLKKISKYFNITIDDLLFGVL